MSATTATLRGPKNPLKELGRHGQSVWLDFIRRSLIEGGELQRMIDEDGLGGVTSNPAIFEKAITGSTDQDAADVPVPGQKYTFGVVKAAQARGDFQVLAERNRRALRVHLNDVETGLAALDAAVKAALA